MENTSTQKTDEAIASVLNPDEEIASTQKTDEAIIDEYFARDEQAITSTSSKYGAYCGSIAYNILENREDAEECVNDTYLSAWNSIPPRKPNVFSAFLGKITRHISIDRWRRQSAQKRGGGQMVLALEELGECVSQDSVEKELERKALAGCLRTFLASLPETERNVFLCRYWYLDSIQTIAQFTGFSQSKVRAMLHRMRIKLRSQLEKEGSL